LAARLRSEGIGTGVHYPVPIHLQPAYRERVALGPAGCRESALAAREVLSLPMFPEMTNAQRDQVAAALARL
jgi:dTDP-4-amino-4,6-dideoxygalactose transaminase